MSREQVQAALGNALLAFQLCLGLWQFLKLTPLGALVQGVVGWLLRPLRLSPSYTRLQRLPGRVFKNVHHIYVLEQALHPPGRYQCTVDEIRLSYLGREFRLERRGTDKNMLLVNGKMCYYITQYIWNELASMAATLTDVNAQVPNAVFLKGHKEIWEQVATGRDMTFEEILDDIIVDNLIGRRLEGSSSHWLLPVDLTVSEEKILKVLNLAGLFLQTKKVYWLIPVLLSFISTVLEFSTPLRKWIYEKINLLFCSTMHLMCDPLPRSMRRQIYALGMLVENLRPSNDINLKVTRGNITAIIAGAAKVHTAGALTLVPLFFLEEAATEATISSGPIEIQCRFDAAKQLCFIRATTFGDNSGPCFTRVHFLSILTLVSSILKNGCGSLKSYGSNHQVRVRGLMQSVGCYAGNGFPYIYEMKLENVVVS